MTYKYKIRSVDKANGTFIVEFDGLQPLNFWIPHNETDFLTGQELEDAIQKLYPWEVQQREKFSNFKNGDKIEELVEVTPLPAPTSEQVRQERDFLLLKSDWTQVSDAPLTAEKKTAWANYRQQLRNVPQQTGFPANVIWPTTP